MIIFDWIDQESSLALGVVRITPSLRDALGKLSSLEKCEKLVQFIFKISFIQVSGYKGNFLDTALEESKNRGRSFPCCCRHSRTLVSAKPPRNHMTRPLDAIVIIVNWSHTSHYPSTPPCPEPSQKEESKGESQEPLTGERSLKNSHQNHLIKVLATRSKNPT